MKCPHSAGCKGKKAPPISVTCCEPNHPFKIQTTSREQVRCRANSFRWLMQVSQATGCREGIRNLWPSRGCWTPNPFRLSQYGQWLGKDSHSTTSERSQVHNACCRRKKISQANLLGSNSLLPLDLTIIQSHFLCSFLGAQLSFLGMHLIKLTVCGNMHGRSSSEIQDWLQLSVESTLGGKCKFSCHIMCRVTFRPRVVSD